MEAKCFGWCAFVHTWLWACLCYDCIIIYSLSDSGGVWLGWILRSAASQRQVQDQMRSSFDIVIQASEVTISAIYIRRYAAAIIEHYRIDAQGFRVPSNPNSNLRLTSLNVVTKSSSRTNWRVHEVSTRLKHTSIECPIRKSTSSAAWKAQSHQGRIVRTTFSQHYHLANALSL